MNDTLPPGFQVRAPTLDDVAALTAMLNACDLADFASAEIEADEVAGELERPHFDPATDAWLIVTPDDQIAGYANVWDREAHAYIAAVVAIHPAYRGRGIGASLLGRTEARARGYINDQSPGGCVTITQTVGHANAAARRLLEQQGYVAVRSHYRMEIHMAEPPLAPAWPPGLTLRGFVPGQDDRAVHALIQECFQDIEGYRPTAFADWQHFLIEGSDFNPALWYLAQAGDELVGAALCSTLLDLGWVSQLAVRRPWRRQGLGRALLYHAFGVAYRAGYRKVGLGVGAGNTSGANALYERVGMHIAVQVASYEKSLCRGEGHTG